MDFVGFQMLFVMWRICLAPTTKFEKNSRVEQYRSAQAIGTYILPLAVRLLTSLCTCFALLQWLAPHGTMGGPACQPSSALSTLHIESRHRAHHSTHTLHANCVDVSWAVYIGYIA